MTIANVRTTTTDRFVAGSGDNPVEVSRDFRVTELISDVPSVGFASAYRDVLIQEGGAARAAGRNLLERGEFRESTSTDRAVTLLGKLMDYESGMVRENLRISLIYGAEPRSAHSSELIYSRHT